MSMKNSNDNIKNRTRCLPGCSAVHQTTAPKRGPEEVYKKGKLNDNACLVSTIKAL
jgi:uncharacterized protein YceK